ncbi:unnamed protein product [Hyaloperonospora brassicae]|uniref:RxLR effector candidate protein n=1 Tax=Hyaloperonospora brassicae TaxID=162125 RepID=A0AAV0TPM9_HYABA|nr:unnamed protein product [Hyaloperonospora brassicae]
MKDGKPRNVEAFLEYLRGIKEMEVFAEDATLLLLTNHPDVTEKMLQSWAKAELDPLEALSRLPWGMFNPHRYREGTLKIPDIALCNWLGHFLRYVTLYRRGHTFADEKVDPWLRKVPRTNARAYLMILQDHRDEVGGSGELAKGLLALHEPTEEDSAVTDEILAKLRMQHPPWSTATVDRLQALSNA